MHILYHKCVFSAAHYYRDAALSQEENEAKYGPYRRVHGHNFTLILGLTGPLDSDGMVINFYDIDSIVERQVLKPFHVNLINEADPWFADHLPSTENLALFFYRKLKDEFPDHVRLISVEVSEDEGFSSRYEEERIK